MPKLSIIIPCFYNEKNISVTTAELIEMEQSLDDDVTVEYVMVDDGSKDGTYSELKKFYERYPDRVRIVKLARNFGANNASLAGINYATGDCNVIIAADLQDPPELIPKMYENWKKGFKLVVAQKQDREDSFIQKLFSGIYHTLIKKLAIKNAPEGGVDLYLFDKKLRQEISQMDEKNTFVPYLFVWLGYEFVCLPYVRRKRKIGKSGWTLSKKIKSFIDSFVSFSFFPIRIISILGMILGVLAIFYALKIIYAKYIGEIAPEGWSSITVIVLFASSFQMIAIGIIGEYVWRTLDASRNRPNFVVDEVLEPKKI